MVSSSQQQISQNEKKNQKKDRVRQKGTGSSNTKRSRYVVPPFIGGGSRDSFLNHFNALGRLLYRKKDEDDHLQMPRAATVNNSSSGVKSNSSSMKADDHVTSHLQSTCFDPGEIIQFSTLSSDR